MNKPLAILSTALLLSGFSNYASATTIGTGETISITDPSLVGQNINFDSTLTYVSTGTNAPYDTGAGLIDLSPIGDSEYDFTSSLGTGANQVQWTGSGGFTSENFSCNVNIGGLATPETLTWGVGGFVPFGSSLVLTTTENNNPINFENNINLGTDASATRQIDVGEGAYFSGQITGSGNLLLQDYGPAKGSNVLLRPDAALDPTIDIAGELTLNNVIIPLSGLVTAGSYNLTNGATLATVVQGTANFTLSGGSVWAIPFGALPGFSSQTVGSLSSTDVNSLLDMEGTSSSELIVNSGYYAGHIIEGSPSDTPGVGGSLIKDGPGVFTLANDNSGAGTPGASGYTQGTTVKQGTLLVTNTTGSATGTGAVTVLSGGSLGGTGIIAPTGTNKIVVQSGGEVDMTAFDPAHPPTLTTNTLTFHLASTNSATFATGASFVFDLGSGGASDELAFTGLTSGTPQVFFNDNQVNLNFLSGPGPGTYTLFSFDQSDAYSGTLQNGSDYTFEYNPTDIMVLIAPEPSVWSLMLCGLLFLMMRSYKCFQTKCQCKNGTKNA